jgi:putative Ca2+/H+ antiporter (TMEM165/GDT1 family)
VIGVEPLATSFAVVALAEIGDKTMLLALVLAARFGKPLEIILGILFATLANHFVAALIGAQAAAWLDGQAFRIAVAAGFVAMGLWTLVPDTFDEDDKPKPRFGAFLTTLVAFFLVEIGDKTQVATIALGARYQDALLVTLGTTAGMLAANVPAVLLGEALVKRISLAAIRYAAAGLFVILGIIMLVQALGVFRAGFGG